MEKKIEKKPLKEVAYTTRLTTDQVNHLVLSGASVGVSGRVYLRNMVEKDRKRKKSLHRE